MLTELLDTVGVPVYIVSEKYSIKVKSALKVDQKDQTVEPKIYWRKDLGCEFSFIVGITPPVSVDGSFRITLKFPKHAITLEVVDFENSSFASELYSTLMELHKKSQNLTRLEKNHNTTQGTSQQNSAYQSQMAVKKAILEASLNEEQLLEMCRFLRYKEAYMLIERVVSAFRTNCKSAAFKQWVYTVKEENSLKMTKDRSRWRLHATANQDIDLQAWYHALFYLEVYRLRGHFWYKDAVLPVYKQSYDLVDNALTPLEEAALAHVLCSPDTTYGDVAGQMFVVQALTPPHQFTLFQQLAAQGATVVKYPRSGRPAKKLFRFSFVEGNIYLTWKGKFGNQGVGMGEVTSVLGGIQSDVLKWSGQASKAEQYLSVNCADRSVDLFFDTSAERDNWRDLLKILVTKEQGQLVGIEGIDPGDEADEFEWHVLYASIGKRRPKEA